MKKNTSKIFWTNLVLYTDIYLLKLHSISIILLVENNLVNICSEITKIWMNLWMIYTCNMKGLEEVEKMGRSWMYFGSLTNIIKELWL